jgi:hypothetical protein
MIEVVLVCDELGVAGRCDLVCVNLDGEMVVVDLKTGDGLEEYARLKTSIQLAVYAHASTIYDPASRTHQPMRNVRQDVAYALHRPLGTDTCQLIEVDIVSGWKYANHVTGTREARNHGNRTGPDCLFKVVADPAEITPGRLLPTEQLRTWILERLDTLKATNAVAAQAMRSRWPVNVPKFKDGHVHTDAELRALADVLDDVERGFQIGFGATDPKVIARDEGRTEAFVEAIHGGPGPVTLPPEPVDEGAPISDEDYESVVAVLNRLDADVRAVLNGWVAEAHKAGVTFSLKANRTRRRHTIYRALIALAPLVDPDLERVRACIAAVVDDAAQPAIPLGSAIGALTIAEAEQLCDIALAVRVDEPALTYDLNGGVRWATNQTNQTNTQEETN